MQLINMEWNIRQIQNLYMFHKHVDNINLDFSTSVQLVNFQKVRSVNVEQFEGLVGVLVSTHSSTSK